MKSKYLIIALLSLSAVIAVSCKEQQKEETKQEVAPLVKLQTAVTEVVADEQVYSSTVQAWAKNNITPQQGGRIEALMVEVGSYVNEGQIVARMEDVQLQQSELQVKNDEIEYARLKSLKEMGGVTQSDFDAFELACKVHKSAYDNILRNTILRSPVTGVISARNYDKGDMCGVTLPIFTVEKIVPVKLLISVSESDYTRVRKGAEAVVSVEAFPGQSFVGEITNIFPTIDPVSHTFNVEIKVKNFDKKLRPGMYAKVTMTFGQRKRVIVPDVAVTKQMGSGDRFVYIYDKNSGTVEYSKVELGRRLGDRYVILKGVNEGDQVVTEGLLRLKNGVKVNVAE